MKNSLLKGLLVFLTMFFTGVAFSQSISGKVSDSNGALPGASVTVKGTTNSQQTDLDGNFKINNVAQNAVLVFSYIGLKTQEVTVAGKPTINVTLQSDQLELKEVMVIGYGTVKKKDATGAVDQLSSKKFDNLSATSPAELLRGKVSGVQVTTSSGEPGAATSIRIRGNTSVRSGNEPLIVVDGIVLAGGNVSSGGDNVLGNSSSRNALNFINQNDIESLTILKDVSSTSIYGSRGANGVIVITTKKGRSKEPELSYGTSLNFSDYSSDFDVLDANRFAAIAPTGSDKGSRSYNWKDAILQKGFTMNHDVAFSKSTENSNTRFSLGSSNTDGIVKNTGLDKYTAALFNSNDYFGGKLKIETRVNYTALKDKATLLSNDVGYIGNVIGSALYWNPTLPIFNPDGSYYSFGNNGPQGPNDDDYLNPVQLLNSYNDFTDTSKFLGGLNSTLKITNHLKYQFLFSVETSNSTRKSEILPSIHIKDVAQATQEGVKRYGQAAIQVDSRFNKTFEHTLNYNKDLTSNINLDALLGYSYYSAYAEGSYSRGKGYRQEQLNLINNIEGGFEREFRAVSGAGKNELESKFLRTKFTLYKKFFLDLSLRNDGSSKLGPDNQYETFYSVAAAYKLVDSKMGLLNDLKIRGVYGTVGNQEFAAGLSRGKGEFTNNGGLNILNSENSKLKWETSTQYGIGTDFTLFKNRVSGSLDYFNKDTKDLVLPKGPASVSPGPGSLKYINAEGSLENKGIEIALNVKLVDTKDFTWDISGNAAFLKNKMKNFKGEFYTGALNGQGLSNAYAQVVTNDQPIYSYYVYEFLGYAADGSSIYSDAAGNPTGLGLAAKKFVDKQPLPTTNVGFSTSITYKSFDFTSSFYGAFGHYIYNNTNNALFFKGAFGTRNTTEEVATSPQALGDPNSPSTKYLEKGDFLRMGNITLGYTFKNAFLEKIKIKNARFYVNGSNLLLFTKYTGFDPEVDTDKTLNGIPSAGMDYLSYPKSKGLAFGLNVTF